MFLIPPFAPRLSPFLAHYLLPFLVGVELNAPLVEDDGNGEVLFFVWHLTVFSIEKEIPDELSEVFIVQMGGHADDVLVHDEIPGVADGVGWLTFHGILWFCLVIMTWLMNCGANIMSHYRKRMSFCHGLLVIVRSYRSYRVACS